MPLVAAGQFCATSNIAHNLAACRRLLAKAVAAGAKALFLPEASDYIGLNATENLALVRPADESPFVLGLQESARSHKTPICVGIHEPGVVSPGERVRNTCIWIDEEGKLAHRYQKVHLFDVNIEDGPILMESRSVEPGKELVKPFPTVLGRLGMLICFDLRFPEISLKLRSMDAQALSYPSAFTVHTGRAGHWSNLLRARAVETQSYVIAAAQVGHHNEKRRSWGHSMIISPWGEIKGECKTIDELTEEGGEEEEICVGDVDLEHLERVRRDIPLTRNYDVYGKC